MQQADLLESIFLLGESATFHKLSMELSLDASTVLRNCRRLVDLNLVRTRRLKSDRRHIGVWLTAKGRQKAVKSFAETERIWREILGKKLPESLAWESLHTLVWILRTHDSK
jgi:DNA-binding MarR family transcriptional regulator